MEFECPDIVVSHVKELIRDLVDGRFSQLESDGRSGRLSASDFIGVLGRYSRTLIYPPESAFDSMDIVTINGTDLPSWSIDMYAWTKEDGESDWVLSMTAVLLDSADCRVQIEDFRCQ